jgi:predicted ABC-type ATPase
MRHVDRPNDMTRTTDDHPADARRPAVGDRPASVRPSDDLRQRLDHLPPGHPSSPHEADQKARSPIRGLRETDSPIDHDSPRRPERLCSFTDAEWVEHKAEVRDELENAKASDLTTDRLHTVDPDGQVWSEERDRIHDSILDELYANSASVPCEHKAIIAGGLPGAGKTTVLGSYAGIDRSQYLTINPDDIKVELAARGLIPEINGLSPMEASDLAHEEASYLAKRLADRARSDGKNIIWDITMSSYSSVERRIEDLRSDGYTAVEGLFVDIPVDVSARRADARHREDEEKYRAGDGLGGRFVPTDVIATQFDESWGSKNRKTFEELKENFDHWTIYDNSVDDGRPKLIDESGIKESI